ncbi:MAG: hypothetical protein COB62_05290 [Piscirickettsiaceae bacterium]|nr:MAG: hypothetical protein COB62_05290 [Piscirickettsiaceae bacterium]
MFNIKPYYLVLCLLVLPLFAIANEPTKQQALASINEAQQLWSQSKTAGHEWSTIKPLVAQAKQAIDSTNYESAIELAKKASAQAKLALAQAEYEQTNWLKNLPK